MRKIPEIGHQAKRSTMVGGNDTIDLGSGASRLRVLSTPSLIMMMELTARDLLAPWLDEGEESVGLSVNIEHLSPTAAGEEVRTVAQLVQVDKSHFAFTVEAFDGSGLIGKGTHRRAVVPVDRLLAALRKKDQADEASSRSSCATPSGRVIHEIRDGVCELILNRPEKLNAIDEPMTAELETVLHDVLEKSGQKKAIRVLVLRGQGRAFCTGEDLWENAALDPAASYALAQRRAALCRRLSALPFPVIARVEGACLGGGLMLALAADWIFATPNSRFALPEIQLGWPPAYRIKTLVERVGLPGARDLSLLGQPLSAYQALEWELVDRVVPEALMDSFLGGFSGKIKALSANALAETKSLLIHHVGDDGNLAAYRRCRAHPDARAGLKSFLAPRGQG